MQSEEASSELFWGLLKPEIPAGEAFGVRVSSMLDNEQRTLPSVLRVRICVPIGERQEGEFCDPAPQEPRYVHGYLAPTAGSPLARRARCAGRSRRQHILGRSRWSASSAVDQTAPLAARVRSAME